MIFTIGHTASYNQYFSEQGTPRKKGKGYAEWMENGKVVSDPNYSGGAVWKTREEAQAQCPPDYSVWGVDADWEADTEPDPNGLWRNLLRDADLIRLSPQ